MKKILKIAGIFFGIILIIVIISGIFFHIKSKSNPSYKLIGPSFFIKMKTVPSYRFLADMANIQKPVNYKRRKIYLNISGNKKIWAYKYDNPKVKSNIYFILFHGGNPSGATHPQLIKLAASMCDATGFHIITPHLAEEYKGLQFKKIVPVIKDTYTAFFNKFKGEHYVFGTCISSSMVMLALNILPAKLYPQKVFLMGAPAQGKSLIKYYNKNGAKIDFMVKMAISVRERNFTKEEKKLIQNAIDSTKPGITDKTKMKQILGKKLFHDISVINLKNKDIESFDAKKLFYRKGKMPNCQYYILHSKNDNIIPEMQGEELANIIKSNGRKTNFLGTSIFGHTQNQITVSGFLKELNDLIIFFNGLFEKAQL